VTSCSGWSRYDEGEGVRRDEKQQTEKEHEENHQQLLTFPAGKRRKQVVDDLTKLHAKALTKIFAIGFTLRCYRMTSSNGLFLVLWDFV
jgi:hypothetical protein